MSQLFDFTGSVDFCLGGSLYPNPKDTSVFLSLSNCVDVYLPTRKRSRISAPFLFTREKIQKKQPSIDVLPDECLFEIFRRIDGGNDRSSCACVSKHWLALLSTISREEVCTVNKVVNVEFEAKNQETDSEGYLSRSLEGKKATDVRLAAISVGTSSRGGLGKLSIKGNSSVSGLTNFGLKAIAKGCPNLKVLSLWNLSSIGDEGIVEISKGCQQLEKLDLCQCPAISDKSLVAIAQGCPNLTTVTFDSCLNVGNETLKAFALFCPNLKSISIKNCPLVGDQGIASLFSSSKCALKIVKLNCLNITDMSLAVIGHYGKSVTELSFASLLNVTEKGFWVMGNCQGLQNLKSFSITACQGVTDLGIGAVGKGCPNLKEICLKKCALLSDNGLVSLTQIESLQLEECHRITQSGFFGIMINCAESLKAISLTNCLGIKDSSVNISSKPICRSLQSLSIRNCPGFGNNSLTALGNLCPKLRTMALTGLSGISDEGLTTLVVNNETGLSKVNISGCTWLTDEIVLKIVRRHPLTLEELNLDGCKNITDLSLLAISEHCVFIRELDVSACTITDKGVATLACVGRLNLQILSISGSSVTDEILPYLCNMGGKLLGLNLQNCRSISSRSVEFLLEKLWRCDILY